MFPNTRFNADKRDCARLQVKRMLYSHAVGMVKENIKMIALFRDVTPSGKN